MIECKVRIKKTSRHEILNVLLEEDGLFEPKWATSNDVPPPVDPEKWGSFLKTFVDRMVVGNFNECKADTNPHT